MKYIIDGLLVLLFVLLIWVGHRRGFIKTVAGVVTFVAALVLASMLSGPVSGFVYDTFVEKSVVTTLTEHVGESSPAADTLDSALASLPAFVTNRLAVNGLDSGAAILGHISGTAEGETVAQSIAGQVIEPVVLPLLKALSMMLLFLILLIALTLVFKMFDLVAKLPLLKQLNKGLGFVAGVAQGALWVLLVATVLQLVAEVGWLDFLTPALLKETVVLRWLNTVNPLTSALRELIVF